MAIFDSILHPAGPDQHVDISATSSSAEILIGKNQPFAITGNGAFAIKFGNTGMGAASADNFTIASGVIARYDLGNTFDYIRLYNAAASPIIVYIQWLRQA